jgi:hypothetical protein
MALKIEPLHNSFQLPIYYISNKKHLDNSVIDDLELAETEKNKSLYEYVFQPTDIFAKKTLSLWQEYYTADKEFLKNTQELLKGINVEQAEQQAEEQAD